MVITFHGIEAFKVQFGDTVLAFNPISKDSIQKKYKPTRFGADMVLVSTLHPDMNGVSQMSVKNKNPLVISGPGEYEAQEVFVKGFSSQTEYGGEKGLNTIYSVNLEGMNICFLGTHNSSDVSHEVKEGMERVDVLFVPIGGEGTLDAEKAYRLAVGLEPRIIIPMLYGQRKEGEKNALDIFLEESGQEDVKPLDKLTLKKKDVEKQEGEVALINPQ